MTKGNSIFIGCEPSWANACVGTNGLQGYWEYARGYSQAADILINTILANKGSGLPIDKLIYPVCFNMRHSIELRLKDAISGIISISYSKGKELSFDLEGSHDIGNIWRYFSKESQLCDDRFVSFIDRMDSKITEIAEIDVTGQTFRYPLDKKNAMHLSDRSIINYVALKQGFDELETDLDSMHYLSLHLQTEYSLETFTSKLSRKNLFELATCLPHRSEWRAESFGDIKTKILKNFNISGRELSRAINIIERHYELAPLIGLSIPLLGVDEKYIDDFMASWFGFHGIPPKVVDEEFDGSEWKKMLLTKQLWKTAKKRTTFGWMLRKTSRRKDWPG